MSKKQKDTHSYSLMFPETLPEHRSSQHLCEQQYYPEFSVPPFHLYLPLHTSSASVTIIHIPSHSNGRRLLHTGTRITYLLDIKPLFHCLIDTIVVNALHECTIKSYRRDDYCSSTTRAPTWEGLYSTKSRRHHLLLQQVVPSNMMAYNGCTNCMHDKRVTSYDRNCGVPVHVDTVIASRRSIASCAAG